MFPIMNRFRGMAIAAAVACVVVACASGPRKSDAEKQADKDMVDRVTGVLNGDQLLYARHIIVRADSGVVNLSGYVWTQPELEDAIRLAQSVPGVVKVVDTMEVDRGALQDSSVTH
ncbi:MAG: BON domain-containing protein [Steroidobacteraceae bacterium]